MSAGSPTADLLARATAWAQEDPDPAAAAELRAVLARVEDGDAAAAADLADRFAGLLQFGTAGLRGALGAGPNRMNRAVVVRAAAGLARYLLEERARPDGDPPLVVVGFDARHGSRAFATDTAAVLTGAGLRAQLLPRPLPTPVLAFAVRQRRADAGVMVTASHNPATDNGYKVYLGDDDPTVAGTQIVPPADAAIAARIAAVGSLADLPRPGAGWQVLGEEVLQAYLSTAAAVAGPPPADGRRGRLRVVATPMHGVGGEVLVEALRRAGAGDVALVPQQAAPDPDFPTVAFPNPEEPGALDAALALARERGADLLLAVDPDADRCAVAVPDRGGEWRVLTGDELGAVLGDAVARRAAGGGGSVLACSIVSSRLLARIAAAHGLRHAETLTGFKWIARVPDLRFGYEEAIGYCVDPAAVRDKDGISTAVLVAAVVADLAAEGRSVLDVLDDLARAHGLHATAQLSVRVDDLGRIAAAMARLRADPPTELAGSPVLVAEDLLHPARGGLPPTDGLRYLTDAGDRVVVRPSGTEPKLKAYLEAVVPVEGDDVAAARRTGQERLAALRRDVATALALEAVRR